MSVSSFLARVMIGLIGVAVMFAFWKTMIMHDFAVIDDVESETSEELSI